MQYGNRYICWKKTPSPALVLLTIISQNKNIKEYVHKNLQNFFYFLIMSMKKKKECR